MEKYSNVKGKDVLKLLIKHGYKVIRIKGSHHILRKIRNDGTVLKNSTIIFAVNSKYLTHKALKYIINRISE